MDDLGKHVLSCCFSKGCHSRHANNNDIIKDRWRQPRFPCHLEPTGMMGKGLMVLQWTGGKVLVWDTTCPDTLVRSHSLLAVRETGTVATDAEHRKRQKNAHLETTHIFIPVAVETLGVFGADARSFFRYVVHRITATTQDPPAPSTSFREWRWQHGCYSGKSCMWEC